MNLHVDRLLAELLCLTADERSAVAAVLIDSLEGADEVAVPARAELQRRREALRSAAAVAKPRQDIWSTLLQTQPGSGPRSREAIDAELDAQRAEWHVPPAPH
jgi:hypothetical protein